MRHPNVQQGQPARDQETTTCPQDVPARIDGVERTDRQWPRGVFAALPLLVPPQNTRIEMERSRIFFPSETGRNYDRSSSCCLSCRLNGFFRRSEVGLRIAFLAVENNDRSCHSRFWLAPITRHINQRHCRSAKCPPCKRGASHLHLHRDSLSRRSARWNGPVGQPRAGSNSRTGRGP